MRKGDSNGWRWHVPCWWKPLLHYISSAAANTSLLSLLSSLSSSLSSTVASDKTPKACDYKFWRLIACIMSNDCRRPWHASMQNPSSRKTLAGIPRLYCMVQRLVAIPTISQFHTSKIADDFHQQDLRKCTHKLFCANWSKKKMETVECLSLGVPARKRRKQRLWPLHAICQQSLLCCIWLLLLLKKGIFLFIA